MGWDYREWTTHPDHNHLAGLTRTKSLPSRPFLLTSTGTAINFRFWTLTLSWREHKVKQFVTSLINRLRLTARLVRSALSELAPNYSSLITLNHCVSRAEQHLAKEARELVKDFINFLTNGVIEAAKNILLEQQYSQTNDGAWTWHLYWQNSQTSIQSSTTTGPKRLRLSF